MLIHPAKGKATAITHPLYVQTRPVSNIGHPPNFRDRHHAESNVFATIAITFLKDTTLLNDNSLFSCSRRLASGGWRKSSRKFARSFRPFISFFPTGVQHGAMLTQSVAIAGNRDNRHRASGTLQSLCAPDGRSLACPFRWQTQLARVLSFRRHGGALSKLF